MLWPSQTIEQGTATSRACTVLIALLVVSGCGAKIRSFDRSDETVVVPLQDIVCVMVGDDARSPAGPRAVPWLATGETLYVGSARVVAEYVLQVVQRTRPSAVIVDPADRKSPFPETTAAGCRYLIVPTITRWEDRPQLTGRDQVGIALHLVRLDPWTVVRSVQFDQHSGNAVIRDQPASDILNDGFAAAIARLLPPPSIPASAVKAVPLP